MRRRYAAGLALLVGVVLGARFAMSPADDAVILPVVSDVATAEALQDAVDDTDPHARLVRAELAGYAVTYVRDGEPVVAPADVAGAVAALAALVPPFEDEPIAAGSAVRMICFADGHDADRLLLVDRWADLADTVAGDLVAVAPSRDLVLFTGSDDPDAIEAMLAFADVVYASDPRPITPIAIVWTPAGWMPL